MRREISLSDLFRQRVQFAVLFEADLFLYFPSLTDSAVITGFELLEFQLFFQFMAIRFFKQKLLCAVMVTDGR
jgi:hypothetical protein